MLYSTYRQSVVVQLQHLMTRSEREIMHSTIITTTMVAMKRRSNTMDGSDQILPLHDTRLSISEDEEDCSTCSSRVAPLMKSSVSLHSSESLPLYAHQLAHQYSPESGTSSALHLEFNERVEQQHQSSLFGNTLVFTARKRKNPIYVAVVVFVAFGFLLYSKSHATLHSALEQVTRLTQERRQVHLQFRNVEKEIQILQRELVAIDKGTGERWDTDEGGESFKMTTSDPAGKESVVDELLLLQEKLRDGNSQIGALQRHLQETSRKDAIKQYGSGIIRVELELEFPDSPDGPNTLVMEMAPLDLMPHSVFTFLEMVHAGLFNGCSFILNAMHVIKAAPLPYDGSSASAKVKSFTKKGLESVAFREYSPDYPHKQYTVGFAADGSPSFYINTQDNTDIHVGDPCFAKIVSGIDAVQRLEASPTRNGIWYRQRIGLKRASILH